MTQLGVSIFSLRRLHKKYLAKNRNLPFVFVDFEKVFEQVHRDVACWTSKNLDTKKCTINL